MNLDIDNHFQFQHILVRENICMISYSNIKNRNKIYIKQSHKIMFDKLGFAIIRLSTYFWVGDEKDQNIIKLNKKNLSTYNFYKKYSTSFIT